MSEVQAAAAPVAPQVAPIPPTAPPAQAAPVEAQAPIIEGQQTAVPAQEVKKAPEVSAPMRNQVEGLVKEAGLSVREVASAVEAAEGKVNPNTMKALIDKHGEAVAGLLAGQIESIYQANKAKSGERDAAIFSQVEKAFEGVTEQSGQETWAELSGWAKENVDAAERKEINKLLRQGGLAAKFAVKHLVEKFQGSDSFTQEASLIQSDGLADGSGVAPLTREEYQRELRELTAKGHQYETSREIAQLQARRMKAIKRGY